MSTEIIKKLTERFPTRMRTFESINLAQAFSGPDRAFFVGQYWWDKVPRPESRRRVGLTGPLASRFPALAEQKVKVHGRWHFILMPMWDAYSILELDAVNKFLAWKYPEGSPFRSGPTLGSPRISGKQTNLPAIRN